MQVALAGISKKKKNKQTRGENIGKSVARNN
jgi:hypothetical protein